MDCHTARARLWPPEQPRVASEAIVEARRHVEECASCRSYFAQDDALVAAYGRLSSQEAPRQLRERVFDALARERAARSAIDRQPAATSTVRPNATRTRVAALVAGGIALVIGIWVGAYIQARDPAPDPAREAAVFIEDYLRRAVGESHIATSDPAEISRFLTRELGMAISPLDLSDLELEGAEICLLEGRRGAMIVYKRDGRVVSHYLIPREGSRPRPPMLASGTGLAGPGEAPPAVVTWATPAVEHALVGPLPSDRLLRLARQALAY